MSAIENGVLGLVVCCTLVGAAHGQGKLGVEREATLKKNAADLFGGSVVIRHIEGCQARINIGQHAPGRMLEID